eukprot:2483180-Prymnesium_polylepis.1
MQRARTWGGSGASAPNCLGAGPDAPCKQFGPLAADPAANPDFATFHRVHIQYCDGGSFAGDRELDTPDGRLHFRGRRILQAALSELQSSFGLGAAEGTQVLLTGCSAGGVAVYLNADFIRGAHESSSGYTNGAGTAFAATHRRPIATDGD